MPHDPTIHPSPSAAGLSVGTPLWRAVALWLVTSIAAFAVIAWGFTHAADRFPIDQQVSSASAGTTGASTYPAPDFRLPTLDGDALGPPDLLGDVVVMELWATWCGPCRLQAQILEQLHDEYGDRVHFLAINSGEDEAKIRSFVADTPFSYPVLLDPQQTVQSRYQANGLPTAMVVDRQGRISFFHVGLADAATLRREIENALQPAAASV